MARVRLINDQGSFYDCVMPPDHVGAWLTAMAIHGALGRYVTFGSGYRLEITTEEW